MLYGFQDAGVEFLSSRRAALLADEPGLGKTIQAIRAVNKLQAQQVLVLCPAVVKLNWERELHKWLEPKRRVQVLNGKKDKIRSDSEVVVLNYDLLTSISIFEQLIRRFFAVGIFDESHYLKSRDAKRTKAVLLRGGVASRCAYRWFLTGTPVLNRPVELYPILKACAPQVIEPHDSFDAFARKFCGAYWDGFQLVATGASNCDELNVRLCKHFMLRRFKKDHLHELPAKQYQMIALPAANAQVKELVKKEFTFSRNDARRVAPGAAGAELSMLRRQLAESKVPVCVQHIKELLEEHEKLVVFAYHKNVIQALRQGLAQYTPMVVTGDTPAAQRQACVDRFQQDYNGCRVFIGQIQAAGVGITLTAAHMVVFVETDWVPGVVDQAIDRCHRIGQKDSVLVHFLVIQDSLEEYMVRTMIDKKQTITQIVDQDPDVARMFT